MDLVEKCDDVEERKFRRILRVRKKVTRYSSPKSLLKRISEMKFSRL